MTKMLQSWIGWAVLAAAVVAVAVFAAIALTSDDAEAQTDQRVKLLDVGGGHACTVVETDDVFCWGRNNYGQANNHNWSTWG